MAKLTQQLRNKQAGSENNPGRGKEISEDLSAFYSAGALRIRKVKEKHRTIIRTNP